MKKIGILLAMLLVAGVCAMADEPVTVQDNLLFADIDAVALSQVEMEAVDGGRPGRSNMTIDGDGVGYSNSIQANLNNPQQMGPAPKYYAQFAVSLEGGAGVGYGFDIAPTPGPYLSAKVVFIKIKIKLVENR